MNPSPLVLLLNPPIQEECINLHLTQLNDANMTIVNPQVNTRINILGILPPHTKTLIIWVHSSHHDIEMAVHVEVVPNHHMWPQSANSAHVHYQCIKGLGYM